MKKSVLVIFAVLLVAGTLGIVNAQTKGNVYSNKFVGLKFLVPEDWYIISDKEFMERIPDAGRLMNLDDQIAQSMVTELPGKFLLSVSERPLGSDARRGNANIIFLAVNAKDMKNDVVSGADFLFHSAVGIKKSEPSATVSDIVTQRLGGQEFHRLNVSLPMQGITGHMSQLARINNDYIVVVNLTADTVNNLGQLVNIADENMLLFAVPREVDVSREGIAFRKESSLNKSGSSGSNYLFKVLMIIGLVLGCIWIYKSKL